MPPTRASITGVDIDGDGFLSQFECDDNNPNINPDAIEIPNNDIDEDCYGMDQISATHEVGNIKIDIFPNPVSNKVFIELSDDWDFNLRLYDGLGQLIMSDKNSNSIDVSYLHSGIYFVELINPNSLQRVMEKVVVIR